jgi:diphosphomevalonate decarboxylase
MQISLDNIYKRHAEKLQPVKSIKNGEVKWMAPSNIALIKYWGKKAHQLPANPSVSLTLKHAHTITRVRYSLLEKITDNNLKFTFDGLKKPEFEVKVQHYMNTLAHYFPFLRSLNLEIETSNSFPHSTGIASSASGMAALALSICSIERNIFGTLAADSDFYRKASYMARLGSGSASRSVYGGFVLWGETPLIKKSSNQAAISLDEIHSDFKNFRDAILIVSSAPKSISSSIGHNLMKQHPYANSRYKQALTNLSEILNALKTGDLEHFVQITENEALILHALMMASKESYILLLPNTLEIIRRIRLFREMQKIPVCFTLDAGANVHMLYPERYAGRIDEFIDDEIAHYCEKNRYIKDREGSGPEMLND